MNWILVPYISSSLHQHFYARQLNALLNISYNVAIICSESSRAFIILNDEQNNIHPYKRIAQHFGLHFGIKPESKFGRELDTGKRITFRVTINCKSSKRKSFDKTKNH